MLRVVTAGDNTLAYLPSYVHSWQVESEEAVVQGFAGLWSLAAEEPAGKETDWNHTVGLVNEGRGKVSSQYQGSGVP